MASHSKPRKKTRVAKVAVKPKAKAKPPKRKPARKPKPRPEPVQVGAPPTDMVPPEIRDTRPVPVQEPEPEPELTPASFDYGEQDSKAQDRIAASIGPMVQGASCTWIGRLSAAVDDSATGMPLCPHCYGHLIEAADEETMRLGFEAYEVGGYASVNPPPRPHKGYVKLVEWMRKQDRCWPTPEAAATAYKAATGLNVDPAR